MKKILLALLIAATTTFATTSLKADQAVTTAAAVAPASDQVQLDGAKFVDGNWFQIAGFTGDVSNYGGPGDSTITDLKKQLDDYAAAKAKAEGDDSDIASREDCEKLAVRSAVRGQYALEVGRLYAKAGDTVKAKAAWLRALAWGKTAVKATYDTDNDVENGKIADNQKTGEFVVNTAKRWLKKIK